MQTVHTIAQLRAAVDQWRGRRERVAFVPTMGNLHEGHLRLVNRACRAADKVVVSIFVNPMQFGPQEDFASYPRTVKQDSLKLAETGVHLLFIPEVAEIYPHGIDGTARVEVPDLSDVLCGAFRPRHFTGVATVVAKLFNAVRPHVAVFGEKDYQQLLVVRRMVSDLCMPIEIIGVPTVRENDGLAMSSRNAYLSSDERQLAPVLYQTLQWLRERLTEAVWDYESLAAQGTAMLQESGFRPDYVAIRRADDLRVPQMADSRLVILAAAWLGDTRLIDNLPATLKDPA
jgi:pantoate--beta-alanine ligase